MTKAVSYFTAGSLTEKDLENMGIDSYEASFVFVINRLAEGKFPGAQILFASPEDSKKHHLKYGMSEEIYEKTSRTFRVTVEEIPKGE